MPSITRLVWGYPGAVVGGPVQEALGIGNSHVPGVFELRRNLDAAFGPRFVEQVIHQLVDQEEIDAP